jgi:hypothetical protein
METGVWQGRALAAFKEQLRVRGSQHLGRFDLELLRLPRDRRNVLGMNQTLGDLAEFFRHRLVALRSAPILAHRANRGRDTGGSFGIDQ